MVERRMAPASVRFQLLDPLRGLAALWVFTFHYGFSNAFHQAFPWLTPAFGAGHLGVPMFFVISGYCLMASVRAAQRDQESSIGSFLRRRSLRILPYGVDHRSRHHPVRHRSRERAQDGHLPASNCRRNINFGFLNYQPMESIRVVTLTQVFAPIAEGAPRSLQFKFTSINAVYWTLAIEFQFYLVMAMALAFKSWAVRWLVFVSLVAVPIWYVGAWQVLGIFLLTGRCFRLASSYISCSREASRTNR